MGHQVYNIEGTGLTYIASRLDTLLIPPDPPGFYKPFPYTAIMQPAA